MYVVATILASRLCLLLSLGADNWSQRIVQRKEVRRESLELLQNFCCVSRKLQTSLSCGDKERVPRMKTFKLSWWIKVICDMSNQSPLAC